MILNEEKRPLYFVKSMATFWDDVGFLAGETVAEAEGFEADGAFFLEVVLLGGDDGDGCRVHGGKGMAAPVEIHRIKST